MRVQPTALSPFSVDLSLKTGWNVPLPEEPLVVDLHADPEGHVSIDKKYPQCSIEQVEKIIDDVDQHRDQVHKDLEGIKVMSTHILERHMESVKSGEAQKRNIDVSAPRKRNSAFAEASSKRTRFPDPPSVVAERRASSGKEIDEEEHLEKEAFMKKVMSLGVDAEEAELLVSSEGESDSSASEGVFEISPHVRTHLLFSDLVSAVSVTAPLREEWFSREELIRMTRVRCSHEKRRRVCYGGHRCTWRCARCKSRMSGSSARRPLSRRRTK